MGTNVHECTVPGCWILIPPDFLMCERHWTQVPKRLRHRINSTLGKQRLAAIGDAMEILVKGVRV